MSTPLDPWADADRYGFDRQDAAMHSRAVQHGCDPKHAGTVVLALAHHVAGQGGALTRTPVDHPMVGKFIKQHLRQHPEHAAPRGRNRR